MGVGWLAMINFRASKFRGRPFPPTLLFLPFLTVDLLCSLCPSALAMPCAMPARLGGRKRPWKQETNRQILEKWPVGAPGYCFYIMDSGIITRGIQLGLKPIIIPTEIIHVVINQFLMKYTTQFYRDYFISNGTGSRKLNQSGFHGMVLNIAH